VASAVGAAALLWAATPKAKRLQRPTGLVGLLASWVLGTDVSVYLLRFGPNKGHKFFDECCATPGRWFTLRLGPDILIVTTDPVACQDIFVVKKRSFSTRTVTVMVIDWFFKGALPTLHADASTSSTRRCTQSSTQFGTGSTNTRGASLTCANCSRACLWTSLLASLPSG